LERGTPLDWDMDLGPAAGTFVNDKEADRYLKRSYRKPWVIPENV